MFKVIILSAILVIVSALPSILHQNEPIATSFAATPLITGYRTVLQPETIHIHEPAIAKVGDFIQKIPTSVSHQSQTIVHNHADVVTPIVAPAIKTQTYTSHVVKAYTTPLVYAAAAPVLKVLHD